MVNTPTKQAVLAYLYSLSLSAWSTVLAMATTGWALGPNNGGFNDWPTFVLFLQHTWFAGIIGLVFSIGPYARAKQGYSAATSGTQPPPEQAEREEPQIMNTPEVNTSTAAVDHNAPANILMTRSGLTPVVADHVAALQASPDSGSQLVGEIIQGGEEYLTGQPVKIKFAVPKETLSFDSTNPFGVKYAWTFGEQNGDIVLIGKPQ